MSEQALNGHGDDVIRAEGLGKTYAEGTLHTRVFDGLDIAVRAGETVASSSLSTSAAGNQPLREAYSVVPVQSGVGSRPGSNPSA
mgnify:CR=1 FL=1